MRRFTLTVIFFIVIKFSLAQSSNSIDQTLVIKADSNSSIYNGIEHLGYPATIEGIPYFGSLEWQKGTIIYREQHYADVYLKYDLVRDEVILRHFNGFTGITMFSPRVHSFTIGADTFVNLDQTYGSHSGIYHQILSGPIDLFIKRRKEIDEILSPAGVQRKVVDKNFFFLRKDGVLHPVRNEKDVMQVVNDKRNQVRSHLKSTGLKYRKNPEAFLHAVVSHYNQSNN